MLSVKCLHTSAQHRALSGDTSLPRRLDAIAGTSSCARNRCHWRAAA